MVYSNVKAGGSGEGRGRGEGGVKNAPVPYQAQAPYLINSEHYLATLTVNDIHKRFKNISIKQTLTELRQNFWICRGRQFVRNIIRKCVICEKQEGGTFLSIPSFTSVIRITNEQ